MTDFLKIQLDAVELAKHAADFAFVRISYQADIIVGQFQNLGLLN